MKFNLDPIYVEDRPNEVKHAYCSSEKARQLLDYKTQVSLEMSLEKIIDFIKKEGPKKFEYNYELEIINENTPETWKKKFF